MKDQPYILRKYKGASPSLTIHLHPTLFRFDQQDGNFSYNSPMKFILEHLKDQTIPHDMIEELNQTGVKFYEGCLIVQVKDHRNAAREGNSSSADTDTKDASKPFSIHNYNNFVTPSAYVPYPEKNAGPSGTPEKQHLKEAASTEVSNGKQKAVDSEPKVFTVVLFPTPLSLQEEVIIQSMTADSKPGSRKQGGNVPRTPASATVPAASTGLVPQTPGPSGPQAKRQKMSISGSEVLDFESKIIAANAAPLFLEPAKDLEDSQQIIDRLTDSLHKEPYPAPKSRKRTVAELAADEEQAAREQEFMLIMDERIGPATSTNGAKPGTSDDVGTAPFQPSFERFNLIQKFKKDNEEKAREKAILEAQMKQQKEKHDKERAQLLQESQRAAAQAHAEQQMRIRHQQLRNQEMQKNNQQNQMAQAAMAQNNMGHGHPNHPANMMMGASQATHSSPVVGNSTPHSNASPVVGNAQQGGIPMGMTSSGQGHNASSPQRPSSSAQRPNAAAEAMARQHSRNPMAQPSRTASPHINSGPNTAHATPPMGHATPVNRMQHGSPTNPAMMPGMPNQNMMMNSQVNGMQLTPQQQMQLMEVQQRRQQQQQRQHLLAMQQQQHQQQQQQQGLHQPGMNMQQGTAEHRAMMQQAQHQRQQAYQQQLAQHHAQGAHGQPPNGIPAHLAQAQRMGHPGQPSQNPPVTAAQQKQRDWLNQNLQRQLANIANVKYGGQTQMLNQADKQAAQHAANQAFMELVQKEKMRVHHLQQQQRQNTALAQSMQQLQSMQQHQGGQHQGGMPGMARGGGGNQGISQQQMMQQMGAMPHLGGNGMNSMTMNGMNMGVGNMNGAGMNMNGMNAGMGNGMGGMQ